MTTRDHTDMAPAPVAMATMVHRMGRVCQILGLVLFAIAAVWWHTIFGDLSWGVDCFYATKYLCEVRNGVAQLHGYTPYTPVLLWVSLAILIVGHMLLFCSRPARRTSLWSWVLPPAD